MCPQVIVSLGKVDLRLREDTSACPVRASVAQGGLSFSCTREAAPAPATTGSAPPVADPEASSQLQDSPLPPEQSPELPASAGTASGEAGPPAGAGPDAASETVSQTLFRGHWGFGALQVCHMDARVLLQM